VHALHRGVSDVSVDILPFERVSLPLSPPTESATLPTEPRDNRDTDGSVVCPNSQHTLARLHTAPGADLTLLLFIFL
jgi:hypothetical protein